MSPASTNPDDSINVAERADHPDSSRLMAEFSIVQSGRYFWYDNYRYEHLEDAVAYAQVDRARGVPRTYAAKPHFESAELPDAADLKAMADLSIAYEHGQFVFDGYHYDHLADATNYARTHRRPSNSV